MKKLLPFFAVSLLMVLSATIQAQDYASIKVKIANFQVDSLVIMSYNNPYFKKVIKADRNYTFKDTLNVKSNKYYVSNCSNLFPNGIYLSNGYDLKINIDALDPKKTLEFSGKGALENQFVMDFSKHEENFDYEALLQLEETDFNLQTEKIKLNLFAMLDKRKYSSDFVVYQTEYLSYFIKLKTETYNTIAEARE